MENPQGKFPAEFDTYQEVKRGDFIFCLFDVEETPRAVGLSDFDGMITGAYTVMQPDINFDKGFLYYFYLNLDTDKRMKPLYTGLRNVISKENFFSFKAFVPPFEEQTAIAKFLDRKTALIDQAILIKEKQIELLKERRQILIHKAVTRGLNPDVKMKDSGVEWIGEIPEHWMMNKFNKLLKKDGLIRGPFGSALQTSYFSNTGYKVYEQKNAIYNDLNLGQSYIPEKKFRELKRFEVKKNDFLMSCSGTIGKLVQVQGEFQRGIINQAMLIIRIDESLFFYDYFKELFQSQYMQSQIIDNSMGSAMKNLVGMDIFKNLKIITPPLDEQKELNTYLKNINAKIAITISLKEKEIEKLKEYKATLINSTVTGKIKVC